MGFINQKLINSIPQNIRKPLGYYPDMLVFQHTKDQYKIAWNQLASASYIYTNGYDLRPAGLLRYSFETFKGWLGFNNHCNENKVQLSLRKFAYYGYLRGYPQNSLFNLQNYPLPSDYVTLICQPRSDILSRQIQTHLTQYYVGYYDQFPGSEYLAPVSNYHIFGSTFALLNQYAEIPYLDPQNPSFIQDVMQQLEPSTSSFLFYPCHPKSLYARTVANYYLELAKTEKKKYFYNLPFLNNARANAQRYLHRAAYFDPDIQLYDKLIYIEYFLEKKDFAQAFSLLSQLSNIPQAIHYLERFPKNQPLQFLIKNSPLAIAFAKHLLSKSNDLDTIKLALHLDENLANNEPTSFFKLLVSEGLYQDAYNLHKAKKDKIIFPPHYVNSLANQFSEQAETFYLKGRELKKNRDWINANAYYLASVKNKKMAYSLEETSSRKEQWGIHKRLYAQLLIDEDCHINEIKDCNIVRINKALKLLKACSPTDTDEKNYLQNALAKGLMRQVDFLTHQFSVPLTYADDHETRKKHNLDHKDNFKQALEILQSIVNLLGATKNAKLKTILGKAYFLIGDINMFFDLSTNYAPYFRLAMKTVPNNPFYLLRCSEIFSQEKDELQEKGCRHLHRLGFDVMDYYHWDTTRWESYEPKISNIKDIHQLEPVQKASGWIPGF